jgi:signal peptidase I
VAIAFSIALFIRCFLFGSYRISSSCMEDSLLPGDYIIASKISYGVRLPQTVLSIPLAHDSIHFLGMKAYSSRFQLPYHRIGKMKAKRNDIVLFNRPSQRKTDVPLDKQKIEISRIAGLPGDTLLFDEKLSFPIVINGKSSMESPLVKKFYSFPYAAINEMKSVLNASEGGPYQLFHKERDSLAFCLLNRLEYYKIKEDLPKSIALLPYSLHGESSSIVIPSRNMTVKMTPDNIKRYETIICCYEPVRALKMGNNIYVNSKKVTSYTFQYNYYWMLSDNREALSDSRYYGLIPETNIISKASSIWFSVSSDRKSKSHFRWNRFFQIVR